MCMCVCVCGGGGGGNLLIKFYTGRFRPLVQSLIVKDGICKDDSLNVKRIIVSTVLT